MFDTRNYTDAGNKNHRKHPSQSGVPTTYIQRYPISPKRGNRRQSGSPVRMFANKVENRGREPPLYGTRKGGGGSLWHTRLSEIPRRNRNSRSPPRRQYFQSIDQRRSRSRSPLMYLRRDQPQSHARSHSRSFSPVFQHGRSPPQNFIHQPYRLQPGGTPTSPRSWRTAPHTHRFRSPPPKDCTPYGNAVSLSRPLSANRTCWLSPRPVSPSRSYALMQKHRSRSRSIGSNMEISSPDSVENRLFKDTFKPVEEKEKKSIKISIPKRLPCNKLLDKDNSDFHGYKTRHPSHVIEDGFKRKTRWDTDQSVLSKLNDEELLAKQGLSYPDEALQKTSSQPIHNSRFKNAADDDKAVQEQLRLLAAQESFEQLKQNLPPDTPLLSPTTSNKLLKSTLPSPVVGSAIQTANSIPVTSLVDTMVNTVTTMQPVNVVLANSVVDQSPIKAMPFSPMGMPPPKGIGPPPASIYNIPPPNYHMGISSPHGIVSPYVSNVMNPIASGISALSIPPMAMAPNTTGLEAFGMPTTGMLPTGMPPTGLPPPTMPAVNGPSPGMPFAASGMVPQAIQQTHLDSKLDCTETIFRHRADLYRRDLSRLRTIPELVEYMWSQGFDPIPENDPPLLFNEILKKRPGILGASALYQIICYGHPELETYYCGMCNHWTTVSEMLSHLQAPMHRLNFLSRFYKIFHKKAEALVDLAERDKFLNQICLRVWNLDNSGQCLNRMRCILNMEAIQQVWPDYKDFVDNSWKVLDIDDDMDLGTALTVNGDACSGLEPIPVRSESVSKMLTSAANAKIGVTIKPSHNTVLNCYPTPMLERVGDENRRSRSRSLSQEKWSSSSSTGRHRSPKSDSFEWDRKTAEFIAQISNDGIKSASRLPRGTRSSVHRSRNRSNNNIVTAAQRKETVEAEQEQLRHTRRALAVLMELQQIQEKQGFVDQSMLYAVAAEMGMDKESVHKSRIIQRGLQGINVVDKPKHVSSTVVLPDKPSTSGSALSLESFGLSSIDVSKLLSKVSETNASSDTEENYKSKAGQNKNFTDTRANFYRKEGIQRTLPGSWRKDRWNQDAAQQSGISEAQSARSVSTTGGADFPRFDPNKIEQEWTDYYMKHPQAIDDLENTNGYSEEQYDTYYGSGTYKAFCAARKRAAQTAHRNLNDTKSPQKLY